MTSTVNIDYWSLVSRSLRIVWKHKFLWFFGFFASASGGGGFNWVEDAGPRLHQFFIANPEILVLVVVVAVIVWIALFVMNLVSTGALVACTHEASEGRHVTFGHGWREGLAAFWRLLAVVVLALIAFLFVTALCGIPVVLALFGGTPGIVIAIVIVVAFTIYIVAQMKAAGIAAETLLGIPYQQAVTLATLIFVLYVSVGGMVAITWTDVIQGVLMVAVVLGTSLFLMARTGSPVSTLQEATALSPGLGLAPDKHLASFDTKAELCVDCHESFRR